MSNSFSAQGQITIKRLRTGDNLFISLSTNKALFQGIDETTSSVVPDWGVVENRPTITPNIYTVRQAAVTLVTNTLTWKYNGTALSFGAANEERLATDTTNKFRMNVDTGALTIIANIASAVNYADDTLTFGVTVIVAGVEYQLVKSVDIRIQKLTSSSYVGIIDTTAGTILSSTLTSTDLKMKMLYGSAAQQAFYVDIWKDSELLTLTPIAASAGVATYTVNRSDVNGSQLFIARFKVNAADLTPAAVAAITITDNSDEYQIHLWVSSTNALVDTNKPVTVSAEIVNMTTGNVLSPVSPTWLMQILDNNGGNDDWSPIAESNTSSIEVNTTHTDRDGKESDVTVIAEVSWS